MYTWLFNIFLSLTNKKRVLSFNTDQDELFNILLLFSVLRITFRTLHIQGKFSTIELWDQLPLYFGLISILIITSD